MCEELKERLRALLGTKFIGFILTGLAMDVALYSNHLSGEQFVSGLIFLFGTFVTGNSVVSGAHAIKDALKKTEAN